jgi:hypothetical protein
MAEPGRVSSRRTTRLSTNHNPRIGGTGPYLAGYLVHFESDLHTAGCVKIESASPSLAASRPGSATNDALLPLKKRS